MSTTHHHVPLGLSWYAAGAPLAGAVLALVVTVFQPAISGPGSTPPPASTRSAHAVWRACFATPHVPSIELARSGCAVAP